MVEALMNPVKTTSHSEDQTLEEFRSRSFVQIQTTKVEFNKKDCTEAPAFRIFNLEDLYVGLRRVDVFLGRKESTFGRWLNRELLAATLSERYALVRRIL